MSRLVGARKTTSIVVADIVLIGTTTGSTRTAGVIIASLLITTSDVIVTSDVVSTSGMLLYLAFTFRHLTAGDMAIYFWM